MNISFVDLAAIHDPIREEIDAAIAEVIDSSRFIGGPVLSSFEDELADYLDVNHVIGVSSGTDALLASLMALDIGRGDEVVTTPFSFFATAATISRLGAKPVFADIDPSSFNIDPVAARAAVSSRTRAVMPVHLYGRPADLDSSTFSVPVIEDAAQSIGAVPLTGRVGCLSFFPTKNLGAFGDGGAIYTSDLELADKLRVVRAQGSKPKYHHAVLGGNFRLDPLQAAILRVKLQHLDNWTSERRANAERYRMLFANKSIDDIILPTDAPGHIYNQFVVRSTRRDELAAALKQAGVATVIYYPVPFHLQPVYAELGYGKGAFPHAERAAQEVLALPIYPGITLNQQSYVVDCIADFCRR